MIRRFSVATAIACAAAVTSLEAQTEITVNTSTVSGLQTRLQTFRAGLSAPERDALSVLLHAAARAPYDGRGPILIAGTYVTVAGRAVGVPGSSGGSATNAGTDSARPSAAAGGRPVVRDSIAPSGAKIITVQGAEPPQSGSGTRGGVSSKTIIVQGGETSALRPPDARDILHGKLLAFAEGLTVAQGATLDWLMQRATSKEEAFDARIGESPTLAQALGVRPLGRRGPGDRRPPPASFRAILRVVIG